MKVSSLIFLVNFRGAVLPTAQPYFARLKANSLNWACEFEFAHEDSQSAFIKAFLASNSFDPAFSQIPGLRSIMIANAVWIFEYTLGCEFLACQSSIAVELNS